jgi:hypothetical protein
MIKFLIILVLIAILAPIAYVTGYGFYNSYDVQNGIKTIARYVMKDDSHLRTGEQMVSEDAVGFEFKEVTWLGDIENIELSEASGLAFSTSRDDVLYALNDSGNEPRLFAMDTSGRDLGAWLIDYDAPHDLEDMATFEHEGKSYILMADTGDNFRWRPFLTILVIEEPDIDVLSDDSVIPIAWSFTYEYGDGYRDCEAVTVDEATQSIYLVSKRRIPAEVFVLPLKPGKELVTARKVAILTAIPQPNDRDRYEDPEFGLYRSTPTALTIVGRKAVIFTYKDAYLFERRRSQDWPETFGGLPTRIRLPEISGGLEAGTLAINGRSLIITGERRDGTGRAALFRAKL